MYASFGHLTGYSSNYYTYMFDKVIALDFFAQFDPADLLGCEAGARYRKTVLEQGGSKPGREMVRDFLGRDEEFAAFSKWLNEEFEGSRRALADQRHLRDAVSADDGEGFRRIALSLEGAEEGSHMGAADFRVGGRIFATLASVKEGYGNLMLTPELRRSFFASGPICFCRFTVDGDGWARRIFGLRLPTRNRCAARCTRRGSCEWRRIERAASR